MSATARGFAASSKTFFLSMAKSAVLSPLLTTTTINYPLIIMKLMIGLAKHNMRPI